MHVELYMVNRCGGAISCFGKRLFVNSPPIAALSVVVVCTALEQSCLSQQRVKCKTAVAQLWVGISGEVAMAPSKTYACCLPCKSRGNNDMVVELVCLSVRMPP